MRAGDWLVYYSPTRELGGQSLKAFTAIGRVVDDEVFELDMGDGFVAFRRRVKYVRGAHEVPLHALQARLELCAGPHWGMALRRGHLPLSAADFTVIAQAMGPQAAAPSLDAR
jgi:hypothetical protein